MTKPKPDVASILEKLAQIRAGLPLPPDHDANKAEAEFDTRMAMADESGDAVADFDRQALIESLESLADDVRAIVEYKRAQALTQALEVYYAAEELARDPANAHLIPHLQAMREAYERDFGKPIPPKPPAA